MIVVGENGTSGSPRELRSVSGVVRDPLRISLEWLGFIELHDVCVESRVSELKMKRRYQFLQMPSEKKVTDEFGRLFSAISMM